MSHSRRILCIDDDLAMRRLLSLLLSRRRGVEVETAASAEEGLQRLRSGVLPDLVITDALMHGMSGYELCRTIRRDPKLRHLRVAMLTAFDGVPASEAAQQAGADLQLEKLRNNPFDLADQIMRLFQTPGEESRVCHRSESFA